MKKDKYILISVIGIAVLLIVVVGITYSFFNYTRTGTNNTIRVGRISFISRQEETINLTNLFPIDPTVSGIMDDDEKVGTLEIEIEGDTDYVDGVEYLITTVNSHISSNGKRVPISLDVTVDDLGTETSSYFSARNSKDTTMYKRLSGDTIIGDQQLLVGYIKPNTVTGTIEGVDGSITIKAYIDKNRIAISDTYDGLESDLMGTTEEWVDDRTVLTTNEWNTLQANGISFQVKVEANEGIWVDEPFYNTMLMNSVMDNIASTNVSSSTGIDFSNISSDTNGKGLYLRAGTENDAYPIMYYRGNVDDNNVYFAGHCWQMVRTTETGGTKMIYNGENTGTIDSPACEPASGTDRQITLNVSGNDLNLFSFSGAGLNKSFAYNGYTYSAPVYSLTNGDYAPGSKFGNSVTWDGTNYTITDVSDTFDEYHHYTCGISDTLTCSNIRYYYTYLTVSGTNMYMYFTLTNGKTIENVISESLENGSTESNVKAMVEEWYEENIDNDSDAKVEDTVYCNDRSINQLGGLNPNGGSLALLYLGYRRNTTDFNPSTKCLRGQDLFTKESSNGNGLLDYSVGLITADEILLAGGKIRVTNTNYYLNTGSYYWSMTPYSIDVGGYVREFIVSDLGRLDNAYVNSPIGLRPVISLKNGISFTDGDGTGSSPYIVS